MDCPTTTISTSPSSTRPHLAQASGWIDLGEVLCIDADSTDEVFQETEGSVGPPPGKAWFYLVEWDDGTRSGYGTESVPFPREPGPGDCLYGTITP